MSTSHLFEMTDADGMSSLQVHISLVTEVSRQPQILHKANTSVANAGFSLRKLKGLIARDVPKEWRRQSGRRSRGASYMSRN